MHPPQDSSPAKSRNVRLVDTHKIKTESLTPTVGLEQGELLGSVSEVNEDIHDAADGSDPNDK